MWFGQICQESIKHSTKNGSTFSPPNSPEVKCQNNKVDYVIFMTKSTLFFVRSDNRTESVQCIPCRDTLGDVGHAPVSAGGHATRDRVSRNYDQNQNTGRDG